MNRHTLPFNISIQKKAIVFVGCVPCWVFQRQPTISGSITQLPQAEQETLLLAELIREYDEQYNHILGYRRMTAWINRLNGTHYSKNRVHRIMKAIGIHSIIRKQPKKYRKPVPERTAGNVLKRDFNASAPNEKWVTDVTEFKWYEGAVCH